MKGTSTKPNGVLDAPITEFNLTDCTCTTAPQPGKIASDYLFPIR